MTTYLFKAPPVAPSSQWRYDTVSGTDSPATILGVVSPVVLDPRQRADSHGTLPRVEATTSTLYLKPLDYRGQIDTTAAVLTLAGIAQDLPATGSSGTPTGSAGGILAGSYPNPGLNETALAASAPVAAKYVKPPSGIPAADLAADVFGALGVGSTPWLLGIAGGFSFAFTAISAVDAATGLPTTAVIRWPDGTAGVFTGATDGANGYTGYAATYAPNGGTTKTVTASGITYDSTTGLALGPTTLGVS